MAWCTRRNRLYVSLLWCRPRCGASQLRAMHALAGTVVDQAGKAIPNAGVLVRNESSGAVQNATTDDEGHFSAAGLPVGTYTIEASAPGFAKATRAGVQLAAAGVQDLSIPLNVESLSQSVNVEAQVSLATQTAPEGNALDATSAKTEISGDFIRNFETPVADYGEVINYSPGTFTLSPNGVDLAKASTFLPPEASRTPVCITSPLTAFRSRTPIASRIIPGQIFPPRGSGRRNSTAVRAKPTPSANPLSADRSTCCRRICSLARISARVYLTARGIRVFSPWTSIPACLVPATGTTSCWIFTRWTQTDTRPLTTRSATQVR